MEKYSIFFPPTIFLRAFETTTNWEMEAFDPSYDTRHFHTFATNHLLTALLMMRVILWNFGSVHHSQSIHLGWQLVLTKEVLTKVLGAFSAFSLMKSPELVPFSSKIFCKWEMYDVANLRVSNLESLVSGGTHGSINFSLPKALLSTLILVRSLRFAAPVK